MADKKMLISKLIGATGTDVLTIKYMPYVYTKWSGKRLVGEREVAIQKSRRPQRVCGIYKKLGYHDKCT